MSKNHVGFQESWAVWFAKLEIRHRGYENGFDAVNQSRLIYPWCDVPSMAFNIKF